MFPTTGEITTETIKAAFKAQAMQAHPDRVMAPGTPPEVQQQAVIKFQKLQVRSLLGRPSQTLKPGLLKMHVRGQAAY